MRLLSLCSGYGGLDLAVESVLSAETVAYAEIDKKAASVFARHWPGVPNLGDLTAMDWGELEDIDMVCAGFPCQDLSYAGKGAGIVKDSRSGLWYAIEHALGVLRPRRVVLENVAAIVGRRPGLDIVLAGLARLGFDAEWTCLRAADVGAPHGRKRWFLAATNAASERWAAWGAGTDGGRSSAGGTASPPDAASHTGGLIHRDGEAPPNADQPSGQALYGRSGRGNLGRPQPMERGWPTPSDAERRRWDGGAPDPGWREIERVAAARRSQINWGEYTPAVRRWERIFGRTVPHPTNARGQLAPPFVEWMMGLQEGWVTDTPGLSRADMLKILGNGVVPQQAAAAISALLEAREVAA